MDKEDPVASVAEALQHAVQSHPTTFEHESGGSDSKGSVEVLLDRADSDDAGDVIVINEADSDGQVDAPYDDADVEDSSQQYPRCAICQSPHSGFISGNSHWTTINSFTREEISTTFGIDKKEDGKLCKTCRVAILLMRSNPSTTRNFNHYVAMHQHLPVEDAATGFAAGDSDALDDVGEPQAKKSKKTRYLTSGKKKYYYRPFGSIPVGGTSEDLNNVSSRFASSARPDEMVLPELPDDVLECELCGRKGRRKNFMRSGRFCGKYCTRSFSSAFRVADQSAGVHMGVVSQDTEAASGIADEQPQRTPPATLTSPRPTVAVSSKKTLAKSKKARHIRALTLRKNSKAARAARTSVDAPVVRESSPRPKRWKPYYDSMREDLYLSRSRKTPLIFACLGLLPRRRNWLGELLVNKPYSVPDHLEYKPPKDWSCEEVHGFLVHQEVAKQADSLREAQVDGESFLRLSLDVLVPTMGMKVGPALKIADMARALNLMSMQ